MFLGSIQTNGAALANLNLSKESHIVKCFGNQHSGFKFCHLPIHHWCKFEHVNVPICASDSSSLNRNNNSDNAIIGLRWELNELIYNCFAQCLIYNTQYTMHRLNCTVIFKSTNMETSFWKELINICNLTFKSDLKIIKQQH